MTDEPIPSPIEGESRNGRRVPIAFPFFTGLAGVVERDGRVEVAWIGDERRGTRYAAEGMVDGVPYRMISASRSRFVREMMVGVAIPIE